MNQSVKTDDELLALLEDTMRTVARVAPGMSLDEPRHDNRWMVTAAAAVIVVAGAAGAALVANNRQEPSPLGPAADAPASTSPDTSQSAGALASDQPLPSPWPPHATIPDVFPADVPRPDTFDSMTYITWDNEPVGWQFLERGKQTDSVDRCTQYAASFDDSWTSTAITDEAASVLYARYFDNTNWRVGIYCTETGDYLVQVMPTAASTTPTVDTEVPTASASPDTGLDSTTFAPSNPGFDPSATQVTIPDVFPPDVPRPDTFDSMTYITWDNEPVGWNFLERSEPTGSVDRCTQYAASFDDRWTSSAITDEAASVLYARYYSNAEWRVGIYCTETGDYLVQVMPTAAP